MACFHKYAGSTAFLEQPGSPRFSVAVNAAQALQRTFRGHPSGLVDFLTAHSIGTVDAMYPALSVTELSVVESGPAYVTVEVKYEGVDFDQGSGGGLAPTQAAPEKEGVEMMFASKDLAIATTAGRTLLTSGDFSESPAINVSYVRAVHTASFMHRGAVFPKVSTFLYTGSNFDAAKGDDLQILSWTPALYRPDSADAFFELRRGGGNTDHYRVFVVDRVESVSVIGPKTSPKGYKITTAASQEIFPATGSTGCPSTAEIT